MHPPAPSAGRCRYREAAQSFRSGRAIELFYLNSANRIMVVRYTADENSFVPEKAMQWSPAPLFRPTNKRSLEYRHRTGRPPLCSARPATPQQKRENPFDRGKVKSGESSLYGCWRPNTDY